MKILIGTEEVDVGDLRDWPNISIKPKPVKPPDECIDKNVIHTPPPLEVLQIGDYVEIWTKQCSNMGHLIPLIWVEPFVIDLPWGSLGHFVSNPVGERLITPIHCTNIIFRCFHYHPPIFHLSSFISHHLYIFHLLHAFWFYLHSCIFLWVHEFWFTFHATYLLFYYLTLCICICISFLLVCVCLFVHWFSTADFILGQLLSSF